MSTLRRIAPVAVLALVAFGAVCSDPPTQPEKPAVRYGPMMLGEGEHAYRMLRSLPPEFSTPSDSRQGDVAFHVTITGDPFEFGAMWRKTGEGALIGLPSGGTAYFRDQLVHATHTLRGTADGMQYRLDVRHSDGYVEIGPTIVYRASDHCFLNGFSTLCGTEYIFLLTDLNVQCQASGEYELRSYVNNVLHETVKFTLVARIPDGQAKYFNQGDYKTVAYDSSCGVGDQKSHKCRDAFDTVRTIQRKGCALTSAVMALQYYGINTEPPALNDWANNNKGYDPVGQFNWEKLQKLAADSGKQLTWSYNKTTSADSLRKLICKLGPQVLEVRRVGSDTASRHFVLATGIADNGRPAIQDPAKTDNHDLGDGPYLWLSTRQLKQKPPSEQPSAIVARVYSPAHITLTDPLGRRVGYGPRGYLAEIPSAGYNPFAALSTVNDDGTFAPSEMDSPKEIAASDVPSGDYVVDVTGTAAGTYLLSLYLAGASGASSNARLEDVPISAGEVHSYKFRYDPATAGSLGGTIAFGGGFTGGGQSASADQLLTYARPGQRQTTLPAGTTQYSMMVSYAPGLDVTSFTAELNGAGVASLFHPTPGGSETVLIPLGPGRNVLKLTARGVANGRSVSDADQLVFKVP